jgi:hypothetical protein
VIEMPAVWKPNPVLTRKGGGKAEAEAKAGAEAKKAEAKAKAGAEAKKAARK